MKLTFRRAKKGQSLAEYGLILALIAIVCIVALTFLGNQISTALNSIGNQLMNSINQANAVGASANIVAPAP